MKYWSGNKITELKDNYIFVFGSNPEGRHGMGAAKDAMKFGAVYGKGRGLHGQTYALVTKNLRAGFVEDLGYMSIKYELAGSRSVRLSQIRSNIIDLYDCCEENPDKLFFVAYQRSNSNLNGYSSDDIFKLFLDIHSIPDNIVFHNSFRGEK